MAEIKIKDININGNDLFDDSEGFMDDLNEDMLDGVNGGMANDIIIPETYNPGKTTIIWGTGTGTTGTITFPCTIVIL